MFDQEILTTTFYYFQSYQACLIDTQPEYSQNNSIYLKENSDQQHYTHSHQEVSLDGGGVHGVVVERCAGSHSSRHLTSWGASPC